MSASDHPLGSSRLPGAATSYARARLRLGILCVGTFVVLAASLLATDAPRRLLPGTTAWSPTDAGWLLALAGLYVLLSAPFDLVGGRLLESRYGRRSSGRHGRAWARGVAVHAAALVSVALVLLAAGRAGGDGLAVAAAAGLVFALIAGQERIALLIGGVRRDGARLVSDERAFVGGVLGLPGRDRTVLVAGCDDGTAEIQLLRREAMRRGGNRLVGVVLAAAWSIGTSALTLLVLPGSADSVAGLATASLWATLLSFAGLLLLPTLSRQAVLAADRAALEAGVSRAALERALRSLDARQEDEPSRGALVEAVFHPVPALDRRLAALGRPRVDRLPRPWNTARLALYLSWGSLGLLSRAVHCNCGRPALWAILPGD